jgi:hypothetical protein
LVVEKCSNKVDQAIFGVIDVRTKAIDNEHPIGSNDYWQSVVTVDPEYAAKASKSANNSSKAYAYGDEAVSNTFYSLRLRSNETANDKKAIRVQKLKFAGSQRDTFALAVLDECQRRQQRTMEPPTKLAPKN